jgi:hypothetical protein
MPSQLSPSRPKYKPGVPDDSVVVVVAGSEVVVVAGREVVVVAGSVVVVVAGSVVVVVAGSVVVVVAGSVVVVASTLVCNGDKRLKNISDMSNVTDLASQRGHTP